MNEICFSHHSIYELMQDLDFQDPSDSGIEDHIWDNNYIKISILDGSTITENYFVFVNIPEILGCEIQIYWLFVPTSNEIRFSQEIIKSQTRLKRFIFKI